MNRMCNTGRTKTDITVALLSKMESMGYPPSLINRWAAKLWTGMLSPRDMAQLPELLDLSVEDRIQFRWAFSPAG